VDLATLVALCGAPSDGLVPALATLVRARLVTEDERDHDVAYEVTHPLIQEAIYTGMSGARRRAAHRAIGRVLVVAARLGEAAGHFARSAHVGDDEAITALRDAVRDAEQREAYREAAAILGALAELLPPGDERWLEVAGVLSRQADWVYRGPAAAAMGIRALREIQGVLERSPDPAQRAAISFRLANFLAYGTGELEEAERVCVQAVELYRCAGDLPGRLVVTNELAAMRGLRGDLAAWQAGCVEVAEAAEAAGEHFALVQALGALATVAAHRGRFEEAEAAMRRNLAVIGQDRKPHRRTMALTSLAYCLSGGGKLDEALPLLDEAKAGNPGWRDSLLLEWGAAVYWMAGDFPAVLVNADDVGPVGKRSAHVMHFAALSAAEMGELPRARGYLARAEAAYGDAEWWFYSEYGRYVDAVVSWRTGGTGVPLAALRRVSERLLTMEVLPYAAWVLLDLAEMAVADGESELASWAGGRLAEIAERVDRPLYRGLAAVAAAWSRLASATPETATGAASGAVEWLSETGCRAFLGRAYDVLGRSLLDTDAVGAQTALENAAVLFGACGATLRGDRALSALADPQRRRLAAGRFPSRPPTRRQPEPVPVLN
jgi:tetratricopeptide (TPR) repeat protein